MTTDAEWNNLTPQEQDAVVTKALWPNASECRSKRQGRGLEVAGLARTWPGFGLVVEAMGKKGWHFVLWSEEDGWWAAWEKRSVPNVSDVNDPRAEANLPSAPSATALAAVRALEAKP